MSEHASPVLGWVVAVRVWSQPDELYFATIADPREAEERVRDAAQITGQSEIKALRELTRGEIDAIGLQPGKLIHAPNK